MKIIDYFKNAFFGKKKEQAKKPQKEKQRKKVEDEFDFNFDDISLDYYSKPSQKQQKKERQEDIIILDVNTALNLKEDEQNGCIAVFEKTNKVPYMYYKNNCNTSMTDFKRKARHMYADYNKCQYIDTRAISLSTHINRTTAQEDE